MKRSIRSALVLTMVLVASVVITACGKKKGGGPVAVPGVVVPAVVCPNCVAGSQFVMSTLSGVYDYTGTQLKLELGLKWYSAEAATQVPSNPYYTFQGATFVHGNLRVHVNDAPQICNIPAGDYVISPYSGGQTSVASGVAHNVVLTATGGNGVILQIEIPRGILRNSFSPQTATFGDTYPYRMITGYNGMRITATNSPCPGGMYNFYVLE